MKKKTDIKTEDVDFERNKEELTFKPNIEDSLRRGEKYLKDKEYIPI
jgi:hypothetical protein